MMLSILLYASLSSIYLWRHVFSCLWSFLSWVCFLIAEFWKFLVLDKVFFFLYPMWCVIYKYFLLSLSFFLLLAFLSQSRSFWESPRIKYLGTSLAVQLVNTSPSNERGTGLIPSWGSKISHTFQPKNQNKTETVL